MTYGREVKINVGGGLVSTRGCWLEDVNAAKSIGGGGYTGGGQSRLERGGRDGLEVILCADVCVHVGVMINMVGWVPVVHYSRSANIRL